MSYNYSSNQTGDLSQHLVQTDLVRRGWIYCIPSSRDARYDLIVDRGQKRFETIQVKTIDGYFLRCTTRHLHVQEFVSAHGKPRNNYHYRDLGIDWMAGVTETGQCVYYDYTVFAQYDRIDIRVIPPSDFGTASVVSSQRPRPYQLSEHNMPTLL